MIEYDLPGRRHCGREAKLADRLSMGGRASTTYRGDLAHAFEEELQSLANSPERCQVAPENNLVDAEIRQLIFGRRQGAFRALFTIVGDEVHILHIRRGTRDWAMPSDLKLD